MLIGIKTSKMWLATDRYNLIQFCGGKEYKKTPSMIDIKHLHIVFFLFKSIVAFMNAIAMSIMVHEVHEILNQVKYICTYYETISKSSYFYWSSQCKVKNCFIWPNIAMFLLFLIYELRSSWNFRIPCWISKYLLYSYSIKIKINEWLLLHVRCS